MPQDAAFQLTAGSRISAETRPFAGRGFAARAPLVPRPLPQKRSLQKRSLPAAVSGTFIVVLGAGLAFPYLAIVGGAAGPMRLLFPAYAFCVAFFLATHRRPLLPAFVIALFAFTPFLRRMSDFHVGFDALNPILLAPYLALFPTLPSLLRRALGLKRGLNWPFAALTACIVYAGFVAMLQMRTTAAIYEGMRWILPIALCTFVMDRPEQTEIIRRSMHVALIVILPILTVYGIEQYINPALWDTFWMRNVNNGAFGYPWAYGVRVFSMMNSPMSVGLFAVSAMILLAGEGPLSLAIAAAALPLLALTMLREAWVICAIGILMLILLVPARRKITLLLGVVIIGFGATLLLDSRSLPPSVTNSLDQRFSTFSNVRSGNDHSAEDRMVTYGQFYDRLAKAPLGEGFGANASTVADTEKRSLAPLDSAVLEGGLTFGVLAGAVYFIAIGFLFLVAGRSYRLARARLAAYPALLIGILATSPIGQNLIGEASILTWLAIGILLGHAEAAARQRRLQRAAARRAALAERSPA